MTEIQRISGGNHEHKYFHQMLNMAEDELDPFEYRLLGHYIRVSGGKGAFRESARKTAKKTKMSYEKVLDAQKSLSSKGYITIEKPSDKDMGKGFSSLIDIVDRWAENVSKYAPSRNSDQVILGEPDRNSDQEVIGIPISKEEDKKIEDKNDQQRTAAARKPIFNADQNPGIKGDELPAPKKSSESNLAKKISSAIGFGQPLSKALQAQLTELSKRYDDDPIYHKFIDEVIAPRFAFEKDGKMVMTKRETAVQMVIAGAGWEQYEQSRRTELPKASDDMFEDHFAGFDL